MKTVITVVLCVSLLLTANCFVGANMGRLHGQNRDKPYRSPFRYLIYVNNVDNTLGGPKNAVREMTILLGEKAFTEEKLKELFKLISKRYPEPTKLYVVVYTSLEQIGTPEEHDRGYLSETDNAPISDNYHRAIFIRSKDGSELIRYSTSLPIHGLKTVVLKGGESHNP